jgi:hypothetical protein
MFTSPALLDRRIDDVLEMITSAARGDDLDLAEMLSVEALVDARALHLLGDGPRTRLAAGIVVGPAALASDVRGLDVALIAIHSWLSTTTSIERAESAARMDALHAESADAAELHSVGYVDDAFLAAVREATAEHHDAISLAFRIGGVAIVALPCLGGICAMTAEGATLGHVSFEDDAEVEGMAALRRG